jgi:general secretion pathway protein G
MNALFALALLAGLQEPPKPVQGRDEILKQDIENAIKRLGSDRHTESYVAQEELRELGRRAVPALVAELAKLEPGKNDPKKSAVKRSICEILGAIREPHQEAVRALVGRLKDDDESGTSIAAAAARALGQIGDESAVEPLVDLLKSKAVDTDKVLKTECIRALGLFRATQAVEYLKKALEDRKPATVSDSDDDARLVAAAAADALGLIRAQDAADELGKVLIDLTNDPSTGQTLGIHAARALQRIFDHELRGKTEKDDARAGVLAGDPKDVEKTHEAWKNWWNSRSAKKNVEETRGRLAKVAAAVEAYKKEQGEYPAILDHLKTKPEKAKTWPKDGYYQGELKDVWGKPFLWRQPGTGAEFDVVSHGADGRTWGKDENADLWNHDKWKALKKAESLKAIEDAVKLIQQFKADNEIYPQSLRDLAVRPTTYVLKKYPEKGYTDKIPRDAYDHMLQYFPGRTPGADFDLISYGADNAEGGAEENEDLWSHDKRPPKKEEPKKDEKKDEKK